jgi:uncharacterized protein
MNTCFFVSDLHGKMSRYEALFKLIIKEKPDFVFIGGDLMPHRTIEQSKLPIEGEGFIRDFLIRKFEGLKEKMDCAYPEVFLIPGNDDQKILFNTVSEGETADLWRNLHNHCIVIGKYRFYGYACVPPTPFMLKDWDRFDVSKSIDPGCISPVDGNYSMPPDHDPQSATIQNDLQVLTQNDTMEFSVMLFHSPPFDSMLDCVDTLKRKTEQKSVGMHVGSKAIRNLIDEKQPYITMHGHIHESAGITGHWKQVFGRTWSFNAAHDGSELAVIKFELNDPLSATRRLIKT